MKKKALTVILIFILGFSSAVHAGLGDGGCPPDIDPEECNDEFLPLDGGVYFLLSVSLFYGALKLRRGE